MNQTKIAKFVLQNGPVEEKIKQEVNEVISPYLFELMSYPTQSEMESRIKDILDTYIEQQLIDDYEFNVNLENAAVDLNIINIRGY